MKKCVLYDLADVYLVTSVRVRMNLVSRKFIVCQQLLMCNRGERKTATNTAAREPRAVGLMTDQLLSI